MLSPAFETDPSLLVDLESFVIDPWVARFIPPPPLKPSASAPARARNQLVGVVSEARAAAIESMPQAPPRALDALRGLVTGVMMDFFGAATNAPVLDFVVHVDEHTARFSPRLVSSIMHASIPNHSITNAPTTHLLTHCSHDGSVDLCESQYHAEFYVFVRVEDKPGASSLEWATAEDPSLAEYVQESLPVPHVARRADADRRELCCQLSGMERRASRSAGEQASLKTSPTGCPARCYLTKHKRSWRPLPFSGDVVEAVHALVAGTTDSFIFITISQVHNHFMDDAHLSWRPSSQVRRDYVSA